MAQTVSGEYDIGKLQRRHWRCSAVQTDLDYYSSNPRAKEF
jgi:hypothetical protein